MQLTCPKCNFPILDTFYFCPNCGKKFKDLPPSTSIGSQIKVYLLSILLPPLGLFPGIKYLLQKDGKAKIIGAVAIILTIISTIITIWASIGIISQLNGVINSQLGSSLDTQINSQLNQ